MVIIITIIFPAGTFYNKPTFRGIFLLYLPSSHLFNVSHLTHCKSDNTLIAIYTLYSSIFWVCDGQERRWKYFGITFLWKLVKNITCMPTCYLVRHNITCCIVMRMNGRVLPLCTSQSAKCRPGLSLEVNGHLLPNNVFFVDSSSFC